MSTNHTTNYNLCQWVPSDKVLRVDFNEDNAKLDTALGTLTKRTDALEKETSSLKGTSFTLDNPQLVVGSYIGNGEPSQFIHLGFRPKAVMSLVHTLHSTEGTMFNYGLALDGKLSTSALLILSNGFEIYNKTVNQIVWNTNQLNSLYIYFAVK